MSWTEIAEDKRHQLLSKIPKEWLLEHIPTPDEEPNALEFLNKNLPRDEQEITESSIVKLASDISNGKYTAVEVTTAFCHRTAVAQQLLNCCSEICFEEALTTAKNLDDYYAKTGKTVGPLHGVPISIKDQLNVEGLDSAIGYIGELNKPKTKEQESNFTTILRNSGAIIYCKTTVPMAMMSVETHSNIYGDTLNALNRHLSCGGSSGGEGALIGARGSLLGLGTDIGGSIRFPASVQGLYGLRPSTSRLPYCKLDNSMPFQPYIPSVIGPIAQDLDDLKFFTKMVIDTKPWLDDPKCPPIPWREPEEVKGKKLTFGIMKFDGISMPHPPVLRAIDELTQTLKAAGHDVVEWDPPSHEEIYDATSAIYTADGYQEILDHCKLSGEPYCDILLGLPLNHKESPDLNLKAVSVGEHWNQGKRKYELQLKYDAYWKSTKKITSTGRPIDAFIAPVCEAAAFKPGQAPLLSLSYTCAINLLDYSTCIVPVTKVDKNIDPIDTSYKPINDRDKRAYEIYDPELFDGAPVSLQVIGGRYEEEKTIYISSVIRDLLQVHG